MPSYVAGPVHLHELVTSLPKWTMGMEDQDETEHPAPYAYDRSASGSVWNFTNRPKAKAPKHSKQRADRVDAAAGAPSGRGPIRHAEAARGADLRGDDRQVRREVRAHHF